MPKPSTIDDKLEQILEHLAALDRRDRLRTIGGFIKGIIAIIPVIILIAGIWYTYKYGDELLEKIAQQAARQAAIITEQQGESVLKQFEDFLVR